MSPAISVIVPTMRVGGLDVLIHGLARQTFRDFELILVDNLKSYRPYIFNEVQSCFDHPIRHLEPIGNTFPVNAYCRSMNTGLLHATGKIVLLLVDYTWLPPDCLWKHCCQQREDEELVVMSPHVSLQCPPVRSEIDFRPNLDHYTSDGMNRYVNQLQRCDLQLFQWSIFSETFGDPRHLPLETRFGHDTKVEKPLGPAEDHLLFYCRNESVRREHLLAINGFDEDLDGSHGYQDSDIADRLKVKLGLKFMIDPTNCNYIVNPRPYFPHAVRTRTVEDNDRIWKEKRAAGYPGRVRGIDELR